MLNSWEQSCWPGSLPKQDKGYDLQLLGICGHASQWGRTEGHAEQFIGLQVCFPAWLGHRMGSTPGMAHWLEIQLRQNC